MAQLVKRDKFFLVGGQQALNALLQAGEVAPKRIFSALGRIGVTCGLQPAVELALY